MNLSLIFHSPDMIYVFNGIPEDIRPQVIGQAWESAVKQMGFIANRVPDRFQETTSFVGLAGVDDHLGVAYYVSDTLSVLVIAPRIIAEQIHERIHQGGGSLEFLLTDASFCPIRNADTRVIVGMVLN